jgi:hypothetical protein
MGRKMARYIGEQPEAARKSVPRVLCAVMSAFFVPFVPFVVERAFVVEGVA